MADIPAIRQAIQEGRLAEAVAACDRELNAAPSSAALWTLKGLALQASGDKPAGLAAFRKAIAVTPSYLPALQAAAQLEFELRDPLAAPRLEAVLRLEPSSTPARLMLGELSFQADDCTRAVQYFTRVPARPPVAHWQNGVCLYVLDRWRDAAAEFAFLLTLREHAPTRFNLALSYWRAKDPSATLAALAPIARQGADADVLSLQAAALRSSKDVPHALEVLQAAVASHPGDERLLVELALLCLDQNALDLGVAVLEAGVARMPASARLHAVLGVFRVRAGSMDRAEEHFRAVERLSPESGFGQVGAAIALMQLGLTDEAIARLRRTPSKDPMVTLTLARALLQKNASPAERDEAKMLLAAVIESEPANAPARILLGKMLAQDGDARQAVEQLETALRFAPADRAAAYQLMLLYRRTGRPADAARMNSKVKELLAEEKTASLDTQRYQLVRQGDQ